MSIFDINSKKFYIPILNMYNNNVKGLGRHDS